MKKLIALTLALAMVLLTACSGTPVIAPVKDQAPPQESEQPETPDTPETPADSQSVKTGLALLPSVAKSADAGEKNGVAQSDIDLVAVLVDDNGVIVDCVIDSIQAKIEFGTDGKLITDPATTFPTKNELGADYGMAKYSPIGKEWSEQVAALAQYAVGKTVEELNGISLGERAEATDADLAASCTISVAGYLGAIAQAVENAQHLGALAGDKLALAASTNMSKSKDAGEKDGVAQAYATVAAVSMSGDTITSCAIDAVQANVNFDTTGKITTDLTVAPLTKNQLGADYGMAKVSSIGKEWNEQAAAFAQYVTCKTAAEVAGIALNEKGAAADADLAASVTVSLGGFQELIAKVAGTSAASAEAVKTGLVLVPSVAKSADAGEKNGAAQSDIDLVAVLVDDNGVIVDCVIDSIQAKIEFGTDGKLITDPATAFSTKNELGADYGMAKYSPIGKEWSEQVAALAQYAVGKTVDELNGISLGERAEATDADLAASCTISVAGYLGAIAQAVENAQHLGASKGDELKLTAVTSISGSTDEGDGLAQTDATVAAITMNGNVISSCAIDSVQCVVNFDTTGKIITDLTAPILTKNQLGTDYGMAKISPIGKEWNEQAAAFAQYVTGKTLDEVSGIALNEKGAAADGTDLATGCTINLYGFQALIAKAA